MIVREHELFVLYPCFVHGWHPFDVFQFPNVSCILIKKISGTVNLWCLHSAVVQIIYCVKPTDSWWTWHADAYSEKTSAALQGIQMMRDLTCTYNEPNEGFYRLPAVSAGVYLEGGDLTLRNMWADDLESNRTLQYGEGNIYWKSNVFSSKHYQRSKVLSAEKQYQH